MTVEIEEVKVLPRSFIARIADQLNQLPDGPVTLRSEWRYPIDQDHVAYTLNVPIDAELIVPLVPRRSDFERLQEEDLDREATAFAKALLALQRGQRFLQNYARKIRREALVQVEKLREQGLDVRFNGVSFKETSADALAADDWKSALFHVIAEVRITICDHNGRREEQIVCVEEPHHIESELSYNAYRQREWQEERATLDEEHADLRIGRVCLDVIEATGVAPAEIWQVISAGGQWDHTTEAGDRIIAFQSNGRLETSVEMKNAFWNGSVLWLRDNQAASSEEPSKDGTDALVHPAFQQYLSSEGQERARSAGGIKIDNPADHLVDLETGRVWVPMKPSQASNDDSIELTEREAG